MIVQRKYNAAGISSMGNIYGRAGNYELLSTHGVGQKKNEKYEENINFH